MKRLISLSVALAIGALLFGATDAFSDGRGGRGAPEDPGVRNGQAGAGGHLLGLTTHEVAFFELGKEDFNEAERIGDGLGPRFNADGCGTCHSQPAVGGTSPAVNPQVAIATAFRSRNVVPSFIRANGPIREARFKRNPDGTPDGGVHALFVISGRVDDTGDARGCDIRQDDFEREVRNNNVIFRIPSPVFGTGLIEAIPDRAIIANMNTNGPTKAALGIAGRPNRNGNDGKISRFGWKAQNQSLLLFSAEAYNVEMGITNETFQSERDETANCQFADVPNDAQLFDTKAGFPLLITAIENFANFQRFLDQPTPVRSFEGASEQSISNGKQRFSDVGCAFCHTPTLRTGSKVTVAALRNKDANLYSDLLLHRMGPGLADEIPQGVATGDEFRTAPLWGLGQRIFFLHDGRTDDLSEAIQTHQSGGNGRFGPSEANRVIDAYNRLSVRDRQDILNFLRSL